MTLDARQFAGPADRARTIYLLGQLEECMSLNWRDVPRDPIVDDDELEYLYQIEEMQKRLLQADLTKRRVARVPDARAARKSTEDDAQAA